MRSAVSDYDVIPAKTLWSALDVLASGEGYRPIAGGTDLMVLFNAGKLAYKRLINIQNASELRSIRHNSEYISIGAAVTYSELRRHALVQNEFGLLTYIAGCVGGVANQNRGTLGGNIANASPAADSAPVLLIYDAQLQIESSRSSRLVPYEKFHLGYKQLDLQPDELITEIRLPRRYDETCSMTRKVGARQAQAISKVSFAAFAAPDRIRIAIGSVAPTPIRCYETERLLLSGNTTVERAQEALLKEISPINDIRSTAAYRARVAANLLAEFMETLERNLDA